MDNENSNSLELTQEEIEKIMALPIREFTVGGLKKSGRYDKVTSKFYFLKDDGTLEGHVANIKVNWPTPDEQKKSNTSGDTDSRNSSKSKSNSGGLMASLRKLAGATDDEISGNINNKTARDEDVKDTKKAKGAKSKKAKAPTEEKNNVLSKTVEVKPDDDANNSEVEKKSKKKNRFVVGIIIVAVGVAAVVCLLPTLLSTLSNEPTETPTTAIPTQTVEVTIAPAVETSTIDITEDVEENLDTIDVIQVSQDLIPGDLLTEDVLQMATLSASDYNLIGINGSPLYQWSRLEDLLKTNNYVTEYIQKGLYLTYDNVSAVQPQSVNPWSTSVEGRQFVTIPLDDETANSSLLSYGATFSAVIQKLSTSSNKGENDEIDGMEHITISESTDTYSLSNIVICDMLNANKESLYTRYSNLMSIPSGEQITYLRNLLISGETTAEDITPKYIVVSLTDVQVDVLGDLTSNNVLITITLTEGVTDAGTEAKQYFVEGSQALLTNIRLAIERNAEAELEESEFPDGTATAEE
ncbi:MAG: hypothetical protein LUF68_08670 [Clostridiales bacterium]|nr:hypothetical protein [Clostridiales bacterium]